MRNHLIEFNDLTIHYNDKPVMENFNLKISESDKIIIIGESGSGKTSILKSVLGFVRQSSGEIYYKGKLVSPENIQMVRREIAYIGQDTDIGSGTVSAMINKITGYKANQHLAKPQHTIQELFTIFGLKAEIINQDFSELSGGEKQRIAIIIAILLQRKIFLMDEITSALDSDHKALVTDYFMRRQKELTLLIVAHDEIWQKHKNTRKVYLT